MFDEVEVLKPQSHNEQIICDKFFRCCEFIFN